jgi:hypothetical protein
MEIDSKLEGMKQTATDCVASFAWLPKDRDRERMESGKWESLASAAHEKAAQLDRHGWYKVKKEGCRKLHRNRR